MSEEADAWIHEIIGSLKLLTTDHGFFCFLTDRSYFHVVQAAARNKVYAREHTNFSHRILIRYTARDFYHFIYENLDETDLYIWLTEPGERGRLMAQPVRMATILEAQIFSREIVHKSELNFIEVARRLAESWEGIFVHAAFNPNGPESQLHSIVQLAIEHISRSGALPVRAKQDPSFAQVADDALYLISRHWRQGTESEIDLSATAIKRYLLLRLTGQPERSGKTLNDYDITSNDENILVDAVRELAKLLTDFDLLKATLTDPSSGFPAEDAPLLALFDMWRGKALLQATSSFFEYRFLYDEFGGNVLLRDSMRAGEPISEVAREILAPVLDYMGSFSEILTDLETGFNALTAAGALPPLLPWNRVNEIRHNLADALDKHVGYPGMAEDFETLAGCEAEIRNRGRSLALSLQLGVAIHQISQPFLPKTEAAESPRRHANIAPLERHLGADWLLMRGGDEATRQALIQVLENLLKAFPKVDRWLIPGGFESRQAIDQWRSSLKDWRLRAVGPVDLGLILKSAWGRWFERVLGYLTAPSPPPLAMPVFEDFWLTAAGFLPSRLMRRDVASLTPLVWTELALHGAKTACGDATEAPIWALAAGLRALGVDAATILRAASRSTPKGAPESSFAAVEQLLTGAGTAPIAALFICKEATLPPGAPDPNIPGLYVDPRDIEQFSSAIAWLRSVGVFDEVINDQR